VSDIQSLLVSNKEVRIETIQQLIENKDLMILTKKGGYSQRIFLKVCLKILRSELKMRAQLFSTYAKITQYTNPRFLAFAKISFLLSQLGEPLLHSFDQPSYLPTAFFPLIAYALN